MNKIHFYKILTFNNIIIDLMMPILITILVCVTCIATIPIIIGNIEKYREFYINPKFNTIDEMIQTNDFKIKEVCEYKSKNGKYCIKEFKCETFIKYYNKVIITFCNDELINIKSYEDDSGGLTGRDNLLYYNTIITK